VAKTYGSRLYTKQIEDDDECAEGPKEGGAKQKISDPKPQPFPLRLAKLWTLAKRFLIPGLQNVAIETLFTQIRKGNANELKSLCDYIYSREDENPLRNMVVHVFAYFDLENPFVEMLDELPDGMVKDVAKVLKRFYCELTSYNRIQIDNAKDYHVRE
jgi:hypothetical protein